MEPAPTRMERMWKSGSSRLEELNRAATGQIPRILYIRQPGHEDTFRAKSIRAPNTSQSHTVKDTTSRRQVPLHRYLSINSLWNLVILPTHSVPGAKNVVRKCKVPSFCPKPAPGTMQIPVASSICKQ